MIASLIRALVSQKITFVVHANVSDAGSPPPESFRFHSLQFCRTSTKQFHLEVYLRMQAEEMLEWSLGELFIAQATRLILT